MVGPSGASTTSSPTKARLALISSPWRLPREPPKDLPRELRPALAQTLQGKPLQGGDGRGRYRIWLLRTEVRGQKTGDRRSGKGQRKETIRPVIPYSSVKFPGTYTASLGAPNSFGLGGWWVHLRGPWVGGRGKPIEIGAPPWHDSASVAVPICPLPYSSKVLARRVAGLHS